MGMSQAFDTQRHNQQAGFCITILCSRNVGGGLGFAKNIIHKNLTIRRLLETI